MAAVASCGDDAGADEDADDQPQARLIKSRSGFPQCSSASSGRLPSRLPNKGQASKKLLDRGKDVELQFEPNMYSAVLVGAYGGVHVSVDATNAQVHPFFLWLLCIPLFAAQASTVFALRMHLRLERIYEPGSVEDDQLLRLKVLMIIILNLINFGTLLDSVRLLVFSFNPVTWVEMSHPSVEDWVGPNRGWLLRQLFRRSAIMPWPMIALGMDLTVSYIVCTDSTSVILDSASVKDIIFNSLAITFIIELGHYYWNFCSVVFHLGDLEAFKFRLEPPSRTWNRDGTLHQGKVQMLLFPGLVANLLRWTTFPRLGGRRSILSRNSGARRLEHVIALVVMYFLFRRQLLIVLFAIDTNVVPAARDICMMFQVQAGRTLAQWVARLFDMCVVFDVPASLRLLIDEKLAGCPEGELERMTLADEWGVCGRHKAVTIGFSLMVGCLLILPHVMHSLHHLLFPAPPSGTSMEETDPEADEQM